VFVHDSTDAEAACFSMSSDWWGIIGRPGPLPATTPDRFAVVLMEIRIDRGGMSEGRAVSVAN